MRMSVINFVITLMLVPNLCNSDKANHLIKKRFIYPSGSVVQFAMGLALPATVTGRNIATNSGILINYALPTNITQLRIPESTSTRIAQRLLLNKIMELLKKNNISEECLYRSLCLLNSNKNNKADTLISDLLKIIIKKILHSITIISTDNRPWDIFLKNVCVRNTDKCNILSYFL